MILHLVRHGHYALAGLALGGRTAHPLDATGRAQARALGRDLADVGAAALYASPRPRALETAEAIAAATGLPVQLEPDLDEIDYGAWTARPFAELAPDPDWRAWNERRSSGRPPGGESTAELLARQRALLERLHARHAGTTIIAVGHCDPIRTLLCHLLGIPLDLILRLDLPPAGRAVVALDAGGPRLAALLPPPPEAA